MTAPAVTVLLPVRDGDRFLAEAIGSILGQSFADFECLVVDDGSTDGTAATLAALSARDARLRVLTQPRLGLVPALNRGLAAARARLIARMDADDVAAPERFERQAAFLDAHPSVALVGSGIEVIDAAGRILRQVQYPAAPVAIRKALRRHNCIAHPTVMARTAALRDLGGFRPQFPQAEDYDLWLRLAERHDLASLDQPLLRYRAHAGQVAWRGHEQRILSELLARVAADCRARGEPDPADGIACADRAALRRGGMSDAGIARAVASLAIDSARIARRAGHRPAARAAAALALRQPGLSPRSRLRCALEWLRA